MRTKKTVYNTITSAILQIITLIAGIILTKLIIVTYGSSINGLRTSITQFISYLYVFEMGLSGAITFSLYKPLSENNYDMINGILAATKKAYKQIGIIFIGLLIALTIIYPFLINKEEIDLFTVVFLTLSIGATGIINYFFIGSYTVILIASQSEYILSISRGIYVVVNTVIMIILLNLKLNIAIAYFLSLLANFLNALIVIKYSRNKFAYLNFKVPPINSALSKRNDVVLHQVSGMVVSNAPVLLLTILTDLKTVSIYSIYLMIFSGVGMLIGVMGNSFTAAFGELVASKEYKTLKKVYSQYEFIYYGIISFVYSCVLILGLSFIEIYTKEINDVNYVDYSILLLFTLKGILTSCKAPQSTIIVAAGHYKETRHRAIIEASLTIFASIILIIQLGLRGALIGSIIGLIYRSIDLFYTEKITKFKFKYTFFRILRILLIIILTVLPFKVIFLLKAESLISWFLIAIAVAIWVGLITIAMNFIFERHTLVNVLKRINAFKFRKERIM